MRLLLSIASCFALATPLAAGGGPFAAADAVPHPTALAEMFPGGIPSLLTPQSMAAAYRLPAGFPPPGAKRKLPTVLDYSAGSLRWDVRTSVTTHRYVAPAIPAAPHLFDPRAVGGAAGGGGELRGGIRLTGGEWELYGAHSVGVIQADGLPPAVHESTTFGGLYRLPEWAAGGRIGASVEFAPAQERRARIEYRRSVGPAEGFFSAEQTFLPAAADHKPPAAVRAGLSRRF